MGQAKPRKGQFRKDEKSTCHLRARSIIPLGDFFVPVSGSVLIFNAFSLARNFLFRCGSLCCLTRLIMSREWLRKDISGLVRPSTIMLHDLIMNIGHRSSPEM